VRLPAEREKADAERLIELRDVNGITREMAQAKTYDRVTERINLEAWLNMLVDRLGYTDPIVQAVLGGMSPVDRAKAAAASRVADSGFRAAMLVPGAAATSDDPLFVIARAIDEPGRQLRLDYQAQDAILTSFSDLMAQSRYHMWGPRVAYPDASNSVRLTYGIIDGGVLDGKRAQPWSNFGDLFRFADEYKDVPELQLPTRWNAARTNLDPATPLNIAVTCDSAGGSSGTPLVNMKGKFVALLSSTTGGRVGSDMLFDPDKGRTVVISASAIIEALRKVYHAEALADELRKGRRY
jgi:hypothetical protein